MLKHKFNRKMFEEYRVLEEIRDSLNNDEILAGDLADELEEYFNGFIAEIRDLPSHGVVKLSKKGGDNSLFVTNGYSKGYISFKHPITVDREIK